VSVHEIEAAVRELPPDELAAFTKWFEAFVAAAWDRRFETDAAAGRLDKLGDEALAEFRAGRTTPL
jgi:hypothetical protein